ncbi:FAD-dependent monooxygenase [Caulobacter sp. KR2-114]|uniref:FAD-dependent monooxygenase n=1 Tax=Caulobacter sp. KR2-114 TaxID=3400912 RepID=UPI003C0038A1
MARLETQVLVVGAGPTGLALAIELGQRGVACTVVERNDRVGYAPRAKTTHTRTREHLRRWGIADKLAAEAPFGIDHPSRVHFVTRLSGHSLAVIEDAFNCAPARNDLYAEHAQWIPQYKVEAVLKAHAATLPSVSLRFSCEFLGAAQTDDGVTARVKDLVTGEVSEIQAGYLVGADGAKSQVRDLIGATMEGVYGLAHAYNIVFRAPGLAEAHPHGPGIMYWQINAEVSGLIGPMDAGDLWCFMPARAPDVMRLDKPAAADLIRRATGIDLPYEVLSADEWAASRFIADRYRNGRMFLIGDACHLHPPTGGYGMNMGIGDSVDLGWKLAARLQAWGGEGLLASYEAERRPVHQQVIDAAVANHATLAMHLVRPELEADTEEGAALRAQLGEGLARARLREFRPLGVMLGYRYEGSPIVAKEPEVSPEAPADTPVGHYQPTARPGSRAPHAWLGDGRSLFDTFGSGFTLLGFGADAAFAAAEADAAALGVPLTVVRLEDPHLAALYDASLALIRPDQHVAWRGAVWPGPDVLRLATGR